MGFLLVHISCSLYQEIQM